MTLHCMEPLIITLPLSQYDLNNVERDVKIQTIINLTSLLMSINTFLCLFLISFEKIRYDNMSDSREKMKKFTYFS